MLTQVVLQTAGRCHLRCVAQRLLYRSRSHCRELPLITHDLLPCDLVA